MLKKCAHLSADNSNHYHLKARNLLSTQLIHLPRKKQRLAPKKRGFSRSAAGPLKATRLSLA